MDSLYVQRRRCFRHRHRHRPRFRSTYGHGRSNRVAILQGEEVVVKSWVYFARQGADGPIKVGHAFNPRGRLRDLSVGSPIALVLLAAVLSDRADEEEGEIKQRLKAHCVRGEWFAAEAVRQEMDRLGLRLVAPEDVTRQETPNDSLKTNLAFRASADELAAWKVAARSAGMSLSQWARNILDVSAEAETHAEEVS